MQEILSEYFEPPARKWDGMRLIISDELQKEMDKKLISASDVRKPSGSLKARETGFMRKQKERALAAW